MRVHFQALRITKLEVLLLLVCARAQPKEFSFLYEYGMAGRRKFALGASHSNFRESECEPSVASLTLSFPSGRVEPVSFQREVPHPIDAAVIGELELAVHVVGAKPGLRSFHPAGYSATEKPQASDTMAA